MEDKPATAERVLSRLRSLRKSLGKRQEDVAPALGITVSALSRLERAVRLMRLEQLDPWAAALGQRVAVLLWTPHNDKDKALGEQDLVVLREVAACLPSMPAPAQAALLVQVRLWVTHAEVVKKRDQGPALMPGSVPTWESVL